jgi:hypothetical protein
MGACGCSDYNGGLKFPGPDGVVYTIAVYPGCRDCDAPAGVILHRFVEERDIDWHEHDPPVPFRNYKGKVVEGETGEFAIPLLNPRVAREKLGELFAGAKILSDGDEWDFKEYVNDGCPDEFDDVLVDGFVLNAEEAHPVDAMRDAGKSD